MNRRSFLSSVLALSSAPAIVRAENIMKVRSIWVPEHRLMLPPGPEDAFIITADSGDIRPHGYFFVHKAGAVIAEGEMHVDGMGRGSCILPPINESGLVTVELRVSESGIAQFHELKVVSAL